MTDTALLAGISVPVLSKMERGFERGDVDAHTSLFKLLPQLGINVYLGTPSGEVDAIKSKSDIARHIIAERKSQGLMQADLALLLGVSVPTISKIESAAKSGGLGREQDVRMRGLMTVFDGLGLSLIIDSYER